MKGPLIILSQYLKTKYFTTFSSRAELEQWQEKKVTHFLPKILSRSHFYKKRFLGHSIQGWRHVPMIDKSIMMQEFDQLNTVGITKDSAFQLALDAEETRDFTATVAGITIGLSSGTSGNRGLFLVSEEEQLRWVGTLLAKILPTPLYQPHRLALFLRANSNLYTSVEKGRICFRFFDLFQSIEENAQRVHKYQPTILIAPPSMLRFLARYQNQGNVQLRPQKIISVAEVLDPLDKQIIEKAFKQKIHQVYQCTEGFLAATCPYGTLHINEDLLVMEKHYLDKSLRKFSPIITDFTRTSQPIIRYLLNDILTEKMTACACGSPFLAIEQIEGRCDDLFYLRQRNASNLKPLFPDFIRRAILAADQRIEDYLVIQHDPSHIEIHLGMPKELLVEGKRAVLHSMRVLFEMQSCIAPHISLVPYTRVIGATKMRRVERRFSCPEENELGKGYKTNFRKK